MSGAWVVKRRHYDGGSSVIVVFPSKEEADACASRHNGDYQSCRFYVEEFQER